jgi:GT2 family glycosyltransferase
MNALRPFARVAVIVLNYNGLEDTLTCLESLRRLADPVRVVLVDNASEIDPTAEAEDAYPGVDVVRTHENLGYAGGNNRGIAWAREMGADYFLVLNNDTVVAPTIARDLVRVFEADATLGVVGPIVNFLDEPETVMTDGVAFNPGPGTEFFARIPVSVTDPPTAVAVDVVNGCCLMIRAAVLDAIGAFDERLFIVHEEADFCLRAQRAKFGCAVLSRTLVWHKGSSAFERSGRQLQRYFDARNLCHLLKRHAGRVGRSRGAAVSFWHYLLYVCYRYAMEREANKPDAADAVVAGVCDGIAGRYGPWRPRRRWDYVLARRLFAALYRLRRSRKDLPEGPH